MYRHRPSYPALVAALCIIVLGACSAGCLKQRVDAGEGKFSTMVLVICLSIVIAGALVIVAFARYKFTHLRTDRAFTKRKRRQQR